MSDAYRPPQADAEASSDALVEQGRILVLIILSLTLADAVFQAIVAGRIVRASIIAGVSLALYHGHIWARLLLILGLTVSSGYTLWAFPFRATGWTFWSVYAGLGIVTHLASAAILTRSRPVDRFLSHRRG